MSNTNSKIILPEVEEHPLEPFLPPHARLLMLGSFPPQKKRWCMEFYYPNWINDMWRIMGHIFYGNRNEFVKTNEKTFDKEKIIGFLMQRGIALYDTASAVRRLKDNASDKFLQIVEATDLEGLLERIPDCRTLVTTGEKSTETVCSVFGCEKPATGGWTPLNITRSGRELRFYRMPSTSRAYPLALEKKAEIYGKMFHEAGLL